MQPLHDCRNHSTNKQLTMCAYSFSWPLHTNLLKGKHGVLTYEVFPMRYGCARLGAAGNPCRHPNRLCAQQSRYRAQLLQTRHRLKSDQVNAGRSDNCLHKATGTLQHAMMVVVQA